MSEKAHSVVEYDFRFVFIMFLLLLLFFFLIYSGKNRSRYT